MDLSRAVELASRFMEGAGLVAMMAGTLVAAGIAVARFRSHGGAEAYRVFRQTLGRAILLGLELLVAADILRTVTEIPSLEHVLILAIIVLIRTFLSFTLEVELEGRWPWQAHQASKKAAD